eukprot:symbB.v1.2.010964.t1/scaffold727.1/size198231/9
MTSQPFKWTDIVMLQDPEQLEGREVSKFHFMVSGQQDEVVREITNPESKVSDNKEDKLRPNAAVSRIFAEKERLAEKKAQEAAEQAAADPEGTAAAEAAAKTAEEQRQKLKEAQERRKTNERPGSQELWRWNGYSAQLDYRPRTYVWGNFQEYYEIRNGQGQDPRLPWLRDIVDWRGAEVLDLGCNSGALTLQLAQEGASVLGVDIDPTLILQARAARQADAAVPGRAKFLCRDMMKLRLRRTYDVVLLLSTSKWVHLQHGDQGLQALFLRIRRWLRPTGVFILEPQPWKAYKKVADAWADVEETWRSIRLRPAQFVDFLTQEVKFEAEHRWVHIDHAVESFQRTIYFLWKPDVKRVTVTAGGVPMVGVCLK